MNRLFLAIVCTHILVAFGNRCPDGSTCPGLSTCCAGAGGKYGCCAISSAVCCLDGLHCCPKNYVCDLQEQKCVSNSNPFMSVRFADGNSTKMESTQLVAAQRVDVVYCPGGQYYCPDGHTCCPLGGGRYSCCPYPSATCCNDGIHCCPAGSRCDPTSRYCLHGDSKFYATPKNPASPITNALMPVTFEDDSSPSVQSTQLVEAQPVDIVYCPGGQYYCPDGHTCCPQGGGRYSCCPYPSATCCNDGIHCCPAGTRCDPTSRYCLHGDSKFYAVLKKPASPITNTLIPVTFDSSPIIQSNQLVEVQKPGIVYCPGGQYYCPDGNTCCPRGGGLYSCCPYILANCCPDGLHCCPPGSRCDPTSRYCTRGDSKFLAEPKEPALLVNNL